MRINCPETKLYYSVEAVARRWEVTEQEVEQWIEAGDLKFAFRQVNETSTKQAERYRHIKFKLDENSYRSIVLQLAEALNDAPIEQKLLFTDMVIANEKSFSLENIFKIVGGNWEIIILPEQVTEFESKYLATNGINTQTAQVTPNDFIEMERNKGTTDEVIAVRLYEDFQPMTNGKMVDLLYPGKYGKNQHEAKKQCGARLRDKGKKILNKR